MARQSSEAGAGTNFRTITIFSAISIESAPEVLSLLDERAGRNNEGEGGR